MSPVIRAATPADVGGVADVYLASRKFFLPYAPLVHSETEVRQWIAEILIPTGRVTVVTAGDEIVGLMDLSRDGDFGWIEQLYLAPSAVGRGLGSQLLQRAEQQLGPRLRLHTFQANTGSRRFYERHGFQAIAFTDGSANEERCPDVLYELDRTAAG